MPTPELEPLEPLEVDPLEAVELPWLVDVELPEELLLELGADVVLPVLEPELLAAVPLEVPTELLRLVEEAAPELVSVVSPLLLAPPSAPLPEAPLQAAQKAAASQTVRPMVVAIASSSKWASPST